MKSVLIASSMAALASAFCDHGSTHNPRGVKRQESVEFDYGTSAGPLLWHSLEEANSLCALGMEQSPIDVDPSQLTAVNGGALQFQIADVPEGAEIENLGTTLEVFPPNGSIVLNNVTYTLLQFHFHTPSEHRLLGEYYPMEVHFVFQSPRKSSIFRAEVAADKISEDTLAVVGFVIEVAAFSDNTSPLLSAVFQNVDEVSQVEAIGTTGPLAFASLMGHLSLSEVYQYGGSLTTPPCSEEVSWNVVREPIYIPVSTYRQVKNIIKFNSRYTQAAPSNQNLLDNARDILDASGL